MKLTDRQALALAVTCVLVAGVTGNEIRSLGLECYIPAVGTDGGLDAVVIAFGTIAGHTHPEGFAGELVLTKISILWLVSPGTRLLARD